MGIEARFGIYFGVDGPPAVTGNSLRHDRGMMLKFIAAAIQRGVYLHDYGGGACHHGFCAAMTAADVDATLDRLDGAVDSMIV